MQGIRNTRHQPNAHLYQSLAILAAEMGCAAAARKWFEEGSRLLEVCGIWPAFECVCHRTPAALLLLFLLRDQIMWGCSLKYYDEINTARLMMGSS